MSQFLGHECNEGEQNAYKSDTLNPALSLFFHILFIPGHVNATF